MIKNVSDTTVEARNDNIEFSNVSDSASISLRVIDNKKTAVVSTTGKDDKSLENLDIKSYLVDKGFQQQIVDIYNPSLLNTYQSLLKNNEKEVERSFLEFLKLQDKFSKNKDVDQAVIDLEENMNEENFEKFLRLKKETLDRS